MIVLPKFQKGEKNGMVRKVQKCLPTAFQTELSLFLAEILSLQEYINRSLENSETSSDFQSGNNHQNTLQL